jgi:hypothetical protein
VERAYKDMVLRGLGNVWWRRALIKIAISREIGEAGGVKWFFPACKRSGHLFIAFNLNHSFIVYMLIP